MARLARIVVPGVPHHITQRGNRRQQTFFGSGDYRAYLELMAEWCARRGVAIWCYCLMPNHVHMVAVPETAEAMSLAVGEAHRRYSRRINHREDWRGFLWQGRFASFPMDEHHLLAAVRYIELNPVRAGLVKRPGTWRWSSAGAHLKGRPDPLLGKFPPLPEMIGDWKTFLAGGLSDADKEAIERHERTGRPLGNETFLDELEITLGRPLRKRKPGPKPGSSTKGKAR